MKYTVDITIDLPREKFIELFDDFENLKHWQEGLQSIEHLSGTPGEPGAKTKLVYQMGKRQIEMVETITERNMPEAFHGIYDAKGVHNIMRNYFTEKDGKTHWVQESEFQFSGFMKLIGFFMKGAFPKQSLKYMQDFKNWAENGKSLAS